MKRSFVTALLLVVVSSVSASGQQPTPAKQPANRAEAKQPANRAESSPSTPPQMGSPDWYAASYQESPRDYIRRRAQEKAEARRARIEGMRWIGYSPLRPTVSSTPFFGHPPTWGTVPTWYDTGVGLYWYHPVNTYPYAMPY